MALNVANVDVRSEIPNRYEIVRSSVRHLRPMARTMRHEAAVAVSAFGFNPREGLRRTFLASFHRRTALIDGRPVAMWGAVGTLLGEQALVWLVLSDEIRRLPLAIVREARRDLSEVMEGYPDIATAVLPDDEASVRFARHLGFEEDGEEGRVPVGDSFVLKMNYRPHGHGAEAH